MASPQERDKETLTTEMQAPSCRLVSSSWTWASLDPGLQANGTKLRKCAMAEVKVVRAVALVHARKSSSLCHPSAESCLQDGRMQAKGKPHPARVQAVC